jgi:hypothetical protein
MEGNQEKHPGKVMQEETTKSGSEEERDGEKN